MESDTSGVICLVSLLQMVSSSRRVPTIHLNESGEATKTSCEPFRYYPAETDCGETYKLPVQIPYPRMPRSQVVMGFNDARLNPGEICFAPARALSISVRPCNCPISGVSCRDAYTSAIGFPYILPSIYNTGIMAHSLEAPVGICHHYGA